MMETQVHNFRVSYKEWIAGVRMARRRNWIWMLRFLLSWVYPVLIVYVDLAVLWSGLHHEANWTDAATGACVLTLIAAGFIAYRLNRTRRTYKKSLMANHELGQALAFNEEYFVTGLPGRSEGRFLWPALYNFIEGDHVDLLYTSERRFIVIPKHAMPEQSWAIFRTLVPRRKAK